MKDIKKLNIEEMEKVTGGADMDDIAALEELGIEVNPDAVLLPSATTTPNQNIDLARRLLRKRQSDLIRQRRLRTGITVRRRPNYPLA